MKEKIRIYLIPLMVVVLMGLATLNGYYWGQAVNHTLIIKGVDNIAGGKIENKDFNTVWQVWDLIKKDYLKADTVKEQDLIYGAAAGLATSLKDPYTLFLDPEESKKFNDDIKGSFVGIGAEIGYRGDFIVVIAPLKNSPAEKAGLKSGDKILELDGKSVLNVSVDDLVKKIRGPRGTFLILTVLRNGEEKTRKIKIERDKIEVPTLDWEMKGDIAYVQLYSFNENSAKLIVDSFNEALQKGANGFVLDLRGNPGGYLEVAVGLAGIFIDNGQVVVSEEFNNGKKDEFKSRGTAVLKDFPLAILINKGSASASEILAGALRDYNNTPLVGEKSFGKGTVQELKELPDGSTLKMTVAHWILPKGDIIDGKGIEPTYAVAMPEDKDLKLDDSGNLLNDLQLDKALQVVKDLIKAKK